MIHMYTYINYLQKLLETAHPYKQIINLDLYYPWLSKINATDVKKIFLPIPSKCTVFQVSF